MIRAFLTPNIRLNTRIQPATDPQLCMKGADGKSKMSLKNLIFLFASDIYAWDQVRDIKRILFFMSNIHSYFFLTFVRFTVLTFFIFCFYRKRHLNTFLTSMSTPDLDFWG